MTPHRNNPVYALALGMFVLPIRLYRWFVSPVLPQACRFEPTCSEYAIEAICTHGVLRGSALTARRLSRCHPFTWLGGSSGFDPVPPAPIVGSLGRNIVREMRTNANQIDQTPFS